MFNQLLPVSDLADAFVRKFSPEDAKAALMPFADRLSTACVEGYRDVRREMTEEGLIQMDKMAIAMIASRFIRSRAKQLFSGIPGVEFDLSHQFFKLYINDQYVLRFKRANEEWLAKNKPTAQNRAWFRNEPILGIRNHCERITTAFRCDVFGQVQEVRFTKQANEKVLMWSESICLVSPSREDVATVPSPALQQVQITLLKPNSGTDSAGATGA